MRKNTHYENFERMATDLLKVPHGEIKAKLEAARAAKSQKPKRKTKKVGIGAA